MILNLNGVPTDMPLYDQDGHPIGKGYENIEAVPENDELIKLRSLLSLVREQLANVDDVGTCLETEDDINVYDYIDDNGQPTGEEYYGVQLYGGLNGHGTWSNYLKVLSDLLLRLEAAFDDAWIIDIDVDCSDDVFYVEVGVRCYESQLYDPADDDITIE